MKVSEHLEKIDSIAEAVLKEKKKKEIFSSSAESAEELYIKATGASASENEKEGMI